MFRIRWPVFVALAVALLAPTPALADEVNPVEGFTGGISDLFTGESRAIVDDPVRDYEYEPSLRAGDGATTALPEEGTEIQSVVNACNQVQWSGFGTPRDLFASLQIFFGHHSGSTSSALREFTILVPIGLVFFWWGVRKATHMVVSAWRQGRATV